ncbi:MAG: Flp pilus assembly complex ATPase component TadA [Candidatus Omnitrophica bacterium]|nr:Flp pilus assembly complex ATPase component TadA [Candidatus Omnitrophota bacterium]
MAKSIDNVLAETLLEKKLITQDKIDAAIQSAHFAGMRLQDALVKLGVFSEHDLLNILAEKYHLSYVDIRSEVVDRAVIEKVPLKIASYYRFLPVKLDGRVLTVAVSVPLDLKTQDEIRMQLGFDIVLVLAREQDIAESLKKHYGLGADTLDKICSGGEAARSDREDERRDNQIEDIGKQANEASVIKIVNQIIVDAYKKRATDIHIEPFRNELSLRYRIDGLLYDANLPEGMKNYLNAIISRIKIMSNLNIVERRLPQDGRAVVKVKDQVLDLRISTIPTPHAESIVIRILPTRMLFSLEKLGLAKKDLQTFEELIKKPHGIIFVTGPTGSGKTTTLYACLSRINTKERKIITIEDPIEYEMSGITQIQIAPEISLDFARGLRSMLRHDPDVMMVGEVRDLETAEIAIRVALTGHLVFSTLHTNDAVSGVTRLIDIGVEPYLLASSVEAFIGQRLVRVICEACKHEDGAVPDELKQIIAKDMELQSTREIRISRGKGCPSCNFTGFFGRTAIYEVLLIDETIRDLIIRKAPVSHLQKAARRQGMKTLRQDGWRKVLLGVTTPEEVMKVTAAEEAALRKGEEEASRTLPQDNPSAAAAAGGMERRRFPRLVRKVNVSYRLVKSRAQAEPALEAAQFLSASRNVSGGGILFAAVEPVEVGGILAMTIELPDGKEPLSALARVVRTEELDEGKRYDIAVCFLDLSAPERARLHTFVEKG